MKINITIEDDCRNLQNIEDFDTFYCPFLEEDIDDNTAWCMICGLRCKGAFQQGCPLKKVEKINNMREATKQESKSIDNYIRSISKPTGKNFYDSVDPFCGEGW